MKGEPLKIVSDSGPILLFVRAKHLDFLQKVVGDLVIPHAVFEDIVLRGRGKPGADEVRRASWIRREYVQDRSPIERLPAKLNLGEREAIILARELDATLLVDEREARKEASRLGIEHFGSLRVLKEAKDRGVVKEVKPILDAIVAAGTYISDFLYQDFLRQMGEGEASSAQ